MEIAGFSEMLGPIRPTVRYRITEDSNPNIITALHVYWGKPEKMAVGHGTFQMQAELQASAKRW
jgi:hypothetical protein